MWAGGSLGTAGGADAREKLVAQHEYQRDLRITEAGSERNGPASAIGARGRVGHLRRSQDAGRGGRAVRLTAAAVR